MSEHQLIDRPHSATSEGATKASAVLVSCVTNAKDIKTKDYDAKEIIECIRNDKHFKLREPIEHIRSTFQNILATSPKNRKAAKEAVADKKRKLPGVLWS